jgi:RHH-type rel operon transcriptional repressor/antitoxin RelB
MNIRIEETLKNDGDLAFGAIGYTPTRAVRALWQFAEQNRHNPAAIREIIDRLEGTSGSSAEEPQDVHALVARGPELFRQALATTGIPSGGKAAEIPYEELLTAAYEEKQQGWSSL